MRLAVFKTPYKPVSQQVALNTFDIEKLRAGPPIYDSNRPAFARLSTYTASLKIASGKQVSFRER